MGRPDQGNKAQTPVGYSHGTGVSTGGQVTVVTGVIPWVTPRVVESVWKRERAAAPPALQWAGWGATGEWRLIRRKGRWACQ